MIITVSSPIRSPRDSAKQRRGCSLGPRSPRRGFPSIRDWQKDARPRRNAALAMHGVGSPGAESAEGLPPANSTLYGATIWMRGRIASRNDVPESTHGCLIYFVPKPSGLKARAPDPRALSAPPLPILKSSGVALAKVFDSARNQPAPRGERFDSPRAFAWSTHPHLSRSRGYFKIFSFCFSPRCSTKLTDFSRTSIKRAARKP